MDIKHRHVIDNNLGYHIEQAVGEIRRALDRLAAGAVPEFADDLGALEVAFKKFEEIFSPVLRRWELPDDEYVEKLDKNYF